MKKTLTTILTPFAFAGGLTRKIFRPFFILGKIIFVFLKREKYKPTKKKIKKFLIFIAINISLPFIFLFLSEITDWNIFGWLFIFIFFQLIWLAELFNHIGFNIHWGGSELGPNYTFFGGILVVVAIIVSLVMLYILACLYNSRRENKHIS